MTSQIESVLREHPEIREAVVLAREDQPGEKRLAARGFRGQTAHGENGRTQPRGLSIETRSTSSSPKFFFFTVNPLQCYTSKAITRSLSRKTPRGGIYEKMERLDMSLRSDIARVGRSRGFNRQRRGGA